jgi:hypothetical protein
MRQDQTNPKTLDLLVGVEAIAHFVFGDATSSNIRRARHWIDTKRLPAGKAGKQWVASRGRIAEHLAEVTAGGQK